MNSLLYIAARLVVGLIQLLPLTLVARLGRCCGALAYALDARHRKVAIRNLTMCFGHEKSAEEIRALAKENFRRIGENFGSAVKTASMSLEDLAGHLEFEDTNNLEARLRGTGTKVVAAIGHFGNFELYARMGSCFPGRKFGTTYRGLRQASLNALMQSLRERSGCRFFERRFEAAQLKEFMNEEKVMLGLLADQHAGPNGLRMPFLGQDCSTSAAPAIFALRYHCILITGICYRVGLAKWRVEAGAEIPTLTPEGTPRGTAEIMMDVNKALETAVRRDPANWFWVHNRWKAAKPAAPGAVKGTHGSDAKAEMDEAPACQVK